MGPKLNELQKEYGYTPVCWTAALGKAEAVVRLIEAKCDVDKANVEAHTLALSLNLSIAPILSLFLCLLTRGLGRWQILTILDPIHQTLLVARTDLTADSRQ